MGSGVTDGAAQAGGVVAAGAAAGVAAGSFTLDGSLLVYTGLSFSWNPVGWAMLAVAAVLGILDLFGLFGGGPAPIIPNSFYRMVRHIYEFITGAPYALTPDQKPSIPYEGPFHGRVTFVSDSDQYTKGFGLPLNAGAFMRIVPNVDAAGVPKTVFIHRRIHCLRRRPLKKHINYPTLLRMPSSSTRLV